MVEREAGQGRAHAEYRPDIDGLRALAILGVVVYHASPGTLRGGFVGVDVFFVISGFLITGIILRGLEAGNFGFADFYARRVRRIVPALAFVLAACLVFGWVGLFPLELRQLSKHVAAAALFLSNVNLWSEAGYWDNAAQTKPLLHLWSLAVEEQYYLAWPLLLVAARRVRLPPVWLAAILGLASFALCVALTRSAPVAAFYMPFSRVWEILAGSLLAILAMRPGAPRSGASVPWDLLSAAGLVLVLASMLLIKPGARFPGWIALLPVAGTALMIAAGPGARLNRTLLAHPLAVALGLISYPLYLWHWPLLSFARIVEGGTPALGIRVAAVGLAVALAAGTYRFVERPLRQASGQPSVARAWALRLVVGLAALGVSGAVIYRLDGVPGRAAIAAYLANEREMIRLPAKDEACVSHVGGEAPFYYCRLRPAGPRLVALVGDSHAEVAETGLAEELARRGLGTILLANSGCPPFLGAEYGATDADRETCRTSIDAIVEAVVRDPAISDVVLFSRGPVYLTGKGYGIEWSGGPMIPPAVFAAGLQRTIDRFVAAGKRVIYVTENPDIDRDPRQCIDRPFRAGQACTVAEAAVRARQAAYRDLLKGLRDVTVVDTLPAFCEAGQCPVRDEEGRLLYADDNHLSPTGSRRQAERALKPVLPGKPGS
ncbi:MAG: acyltransferase family protein [Alsobacter sp.]